MVEEAGVITSPVNVAPAIGAAPKFVNAAAAVVAPVPPFAIATVPDTLIAVPEISPVIFDPETDLIFSSVTAFVAIFNSVTALLAILNESTAELAIFALVTFSAPIVVAPALSIVKSPDIATG